MKKLFICLAALLASLGLGAQGVKPLPTLHVEGRWLVDAHGNHVVLHGVMDTPNMYFNGWRWGSPWDANNRSNYDANGATKCLDYFEKIFTGLEKAHCTVFRLHLDPAWTNDPDSKYIYSGSNGQASDVSGEADIKKFNPQRLKTFLTSLYWPLMKQAMDHGMYVVVRPPGVCPTNLKVGDYYNNYLMTVWDIVTQDANIRQYAGQISIELANEPVNLRNANNQDDAKAMHDFFQPIVDKMRQNGFTGIIWAPGTGFQSNYTSYSSYPIEGENIGYAVHDYTGWYGSSDQEPSSDLKIANFHSQVPVVDFAPVIITEVDWSPENPNAEGHYNEHGDWVLPNYGTWSTGSTSKWGKAFKACLDHYGNISMTLSGTSCLIDVDQLLKDGSVVPAFGGLEEACGKACMDWYADYYLVDWPHADDEPQSPASQKAVSLAIDGAPEVQVGGSSVLRITAIFEDGHEREVTSSARLTVTGGSAVEERYGRLFGLAEGSATVTVSYTDPLGNELTQQFAVRSTFFPFGRQYIKTDFFANGVYTESTHTFKPGQYGQMGWEYPDGADMSAYKYLVVKLASTSTNSHLNIFTEGSIWSSCCATADFGQKTQIVVNLGAAKYTSGDKTGQKLDTKNVRIVSFWGMGDKTIVVKDMYLTNNSDYSPESSQGIVHSPEFIVQSTETRVYSLQGVAQGSHLKKGLYIVNGRKVAVR